MCFDGLEYRWDILSSHAAFTDGIIVFIQFNLSSIQISLIKSSGNTSDNREQLQFYFHITEQYTFEMYSLDEARIKWVLEGYDKKSNPRIINLIVKKKIYFDWGKQSKRLT